MRFLYIKEMVKEAAQAFKLSTEGKYNCKYEKKDTIFIRGVGEQLQTLEGTRNKLERH
jgi:hypothetical protein